MKKDCLGILIFALLLISGSAVASKGTRGSDFLYKDCVSGNDSSSVIVIEFSEHDDFRQNSGPKIVEFYSPLNEDCRSYKQKFIELSKQITKHNPTVKVYAVSCDVYKDICDTFAVSIYPSLIAFPDSAEHQSALLAATQYKHVDINDATPIKVLEALELGGANDDGTSLMVETHRRLQQKPGAAKAADKQKDTNNKWKQEFEKKKKEAEKKQATVSPKKGAKTMPLRIVTQDATGTTEIMKKNTPGTQQFIDKVVQMNNNNGKQEKKPAQGIVKNNMQVPKKEEMAKVEAKKLNFAQKQLAKVPLVRRAFKMTREEAMINDASIFFRDGIRAGAFTSKGSMGPDEKAALKKWLELLAVSLPPEWGLHVLIEHLLISLDVVSKSVAEMNKVLNKHRLPQSMWSDSCKKSKLGAMKCGMYKLLHTVSLGIAEHRGGLNLVESGMVEHNKTTFSPAEAGDAIHDYIMYFVRDESCRKDFLDSYDNCDYRLCHRLSESKEESLPDDWKQVSLWIWEVHNADNLIFLNTTVNKNVKSKGGKLPTMEQEIKALWPPLNECLVCIDDSGEWNEDAVFEYLERSYWEGPDTKYDKLLSFKRLHGQDFTAGGFIWFMLVGAVAVALIAARQIKGASTNHGLKRPKSTSVSVSDINRKLAEFMVGNFNVKKC